MSRILTMLANPTPAHLITRLHRHHSGRCVDKSLAMFLRKCRIRVLMRSMCCTQYSQQLERTRRSDPGCTIAAAHQGLDNVWASAANPFKIRTVD